MDDLVFAPEKIACQFCAQALESERFAAHRRIAAPDDTVHAYTILAAPTAEDPAYASVVFLCDIVFPLPARVGLELQAYALVPTLELMAALQEASPQEAEQVGADAVFAALRSK